jgi:hypothetical protein
MPLPRINHFLSRQCHWISWNAFCILSLGLQRAGGEETMKIYLLILLIGTLLTAIHFTSRPERQSETAPQ